MFGLSLFRPSQQSNISTSGEERFKYPLPRESKVSQMPYPAANKDNQIPTPCPASPPPPTPAGIPLIGVLAPWGRGLVSQSLRYPTPPLNRFLVDDSLTKHFYFLVILNLVPSLAERRCLCKQRSLISVD